MSTAIPASAVSPALRVRAVITSEWIKFRVLRSVPILASLASLLTIGVAALACSNHVAHARRVPAAQLAAIDPINACLGAIDVGALFVGALGVLAVTAEYGQGLIRSTFAATPQRGAVLAAKAAVCTAVALTTSAVMTFGAYFTGQSILAPYVHDGGLTDPGVLRRLLGAVFYLTSVGLIGLFLGALTRSTAWAVTALFALFLVVPSLLGDLPRTSVWHRIVPYLPANLGHALWHSHNGDLASPTVAAVVLPVYIVALGWLSASALRRRDA